MLNRYSALTLITLITLGIHTSPTWAGSVNGRGGARGRGTTTGQIAVRGQGQAEGTGIAVYRDNQGRVRTKQGTGSVSSQGIAIGRGSATAEGTAVGRGSAQGQGRARSF